MVFNPTKVLKNLGIGRNRGRERRTMVAEKSRDRAPLKWRNYVEDGSPDFVIGSLLTTCAVLLIFLIAFFAR